MRPMRLLCFPRMCWTYVAIITLMLQLSACCFHSVRYFTAYTVQPKTKTGGQPEKAHLVNTIHHVSAHYELSLDPKFNGTDTLGFFGKPYHYFKFWLEQKNQETIVNLDYFGLYGNRKKIPYQGFLSTLSDSMQANFIVIDHLFHEANTKDVK